MSQHLRSFLPADGRYLRSLPADARPRHMRMPVRLPDGYLLRLDMSMVVSAVESMILSAPTQVITRVLQSAQPGVIQAPSLESYETFLTERPGRVSSHTSYGAKYVRPSKQAIG